MRLESFIFSTIGGILSLCPLPGTAAESGDGEPRRSGWYVGAGVGGNWASDMDQEGWNRETLCYPTDACFDVDPAPEISGYRWHYDIDADAGAAFELSFGRIFGRARLELSLAQRRNDIDQTFRSITYYDGTPEEARSGGSVVSRAKTSIDDLTARILSLNAYYDFPEAYRGMTPYLGIGLGLAFVEVSGVKFSSGYEDSSNPPAAYDPPLSFYASRQSEDLSDTVVVGHLHAGVDYSLNDNTLLGLKLTYSIMDEIEDTGRYSVHPFHAQNPGLTNRNTFDDVRSWTLTLTLKRLFGS